MSVKISAKVWEWSQSEGTDRLVMLALSDFCDDEGECYPGISRIAKKCRVSERTVQRSISALETSGELRIDRGCGVTTKSGPTNRFTLIFSRGDNMTPGDNQGTQGVTTKARRGDTAMSPKSSVEPSVEPSEVQAPSLPLEIHKGRKPFTPPTKTEVKVYMAELGMNGTAEREAEKFLNHHEARGWWLSKGVKAKDWRAMARTWKGNADTFATRDGKTAPGTGKGESKEEAAEIQRQWEIFLKANGYWNHPTIRREFEYGADYLKTDFRKWWKQQEAVK